MQSFLNCLTSQNNKLSMIRTLRKTLSIPTAVEALEVEIEFVPRTQDRGVKLVVPFNANIKLQLVAYQSP